MSSSVKEYNCIPKEKFVASVLRWLFWGRKNCPLELQYFFTDYTRIWLLTETGAGDCRPLQLFPSSWVLHVTFSQLYSTSIPYPPGSSPSLPSSVASVVADVLEV